MIFEILKFTDFNSNLTDIFFASKINCLFFFSFIVNSRSYYKFYVNVVLTIITNLKWRNIYKPVNIENSHKLMLWKQYC